MSIVLLYAVSIGVVALSFGLYFLLNLRKVKIKGVKESDKEKPEPKTAPEVARICDNVNRSLYTDIIDGAILDQIKNKYGTLGRKWVYYGKQIYAFTRIGESDYEPTYLDVPGLDNPPEAIYRRVHQPAVAVVFNVEKKTNLFSKWGWLFLFVGAVLFIMAIILKG